MSEELDEVAKHFKVKYTNEMCEFCGSRIDEFSMCACGAGWLLASVFFLMRNYCFQFSDHLPTNG